MTNPDNVGGLPELPEPYQTVTIINHDASTRRTCGLHTDDSMRAYGELCRAAPAGGECQHEWQPDADVMNARYCPKCDVTQTIPRKQAKDSAPAGSGEVSIGAAWLELVANRWDKSQKISPMECDRLLSIAAILRKLQQGAECFVREMRTSKGSEFFVVVRCNGRELTPHMYTERWKAEYDVASWQHLLSGAPEPDILAYGPASQGQEGGHARD